MLKKLHSLSGVVPLGVFVVLHLWITASIASSRAVYDHQIGLIHSGVLGVLEPLVIAPLFFHGIYGIVRALGPRDPEHAYDSDVMATLQRISGLAVLVFVGLHVWEFRGATWTQGLGESAYSTKLVQDLSSTRYGVPWIALGYVVGMAASLFHLANGMTSFCTRWGYTRTRAAQDRARLVFRVAGVLLFGLSSAIVVQLATGSRLFPQAADATSSELECGPNAVSPPLPAHAIPPAGARPPPSSLPSPLPSGGH
jgi:succinate dehydrogenase / fumarate reductase cytochrome b subunit